MCGWQGTGRGRKVFRRGSVQCHNTRQSGIQQAAQIASSDHATALSALPIYCQQPRRSRVGEEKICKICSMTDGRGASGNRTRPVAGLAVMYSRAVYSGRPGRDGSRPDHGLRSECVHPLASACICKQAAHRWSTQSALDPVAPTTGRAAFLPPPGARTHCRARAVRAPHLTSWFTNRRPPGGYERISACDTQANRCVR